MKLFRSWWLRKKNREKQLQLKDRTMRLSLGRLEDEELQAIATKDQEEYRSEAVTFAREELRRRNVEVRPPLDLVGEVLQLLREVGVEPRVEGDRTRVVLPAAPGSDYGFVVHIQEGARHVVAELLSDDQKEEPLWYMEGPLSLSEVEDLATSETRIRETQSILWRSIVCEINRGGWWERFFSWYVFIMGKRGPRHGHTYYSHPIVGK